MSMLKRIFAILVAVCIMISCCFCVMAESSTDAMTEISSAFSEYKLGNTINVKDDGYIGIPVDVSVFFDKTNFTAKSGYNGTQVIIYVVNTNTTRVGTDSDVSIITSMLERGYIVTVFDYKNNPLATGQPLEWSVQGLRVSVKDKTFLTDPVFPAGTYYDNYMVPAGYDVSLNNIYWEMDKHASDGTFDWIINNWNTDFRNIKGDKLVKWVHSDGTRKKVLEGAVWCNASGTADVDGEYVKVKYTVAEKITDCVKPDGSPIDLNQRMSFVYPTNPAKKVPVYCMASSSQYLAANPQTADRIHFNGFVFRGYAGAVYEYGYIPMARDDSYGVYNGSKSNNSSAISDDADNYGVHMYDDKRLNTAAMRYIRYKALSEPSVYHFDIDHIGIVGNSKGGAMSFVGEKIVQEPLVSDPSSYATTAELELAIDSKINSIISRRGHVGHNNETRFQNGDTNTYTEDGITIDGGEIQPWLTYNGVEIESGAQLVWASNGVSGEDISEGHSPQIVMCHEQDPWHYYGPLNEFANTCRSHNIPMLHFEVPLGHTVAYGKDKNYDVDVYEASFDFIDYYLKGEPVKVLYTDPQNGAANVRATSPILVKFSGGVSPSEVNKITLSANGENVSGTWKSSYGNTSWEFTPDVMEGNTRYTLTVPSTLKGENGVAMGMDYTTDLYTEYNINDIATDISDISGGKLVAVTAPQLDGAGNSVKLRFRVTNDGANVVGVYTEANTLVDKVNIKGQGYYEVDVTDYVADMQGQQVKFIVKEEKTQGVSNIYTSDFENNMNKCTVAEMTEISLSAAPDSTPALKVIKTNSGDKYTQHVIYNSSRMPAFTVSNILGFKITEADYGRKFTFKVKVYDTVSRNFQLKLNTNTHSTKEVADYDNPMYNFTTKANEWTTYSFDYAVYDTDYGKIGLKNKNLIVSVSHAGTAEPPLYVGEITVDETVTDVSMDNFSVAVEKESGIPYKSAEDSSVFSIYDGTVRVSGYNSLKEALSAYKYGYTLKLTDNYTLTDSDLWGDYATLSAAKGADGHIVNIDLNEYTINCRNEKNSLLWLKNTSTANGKTVINVSNGAINLKNTSLVSFESSTSAGAGKEYDINLNNINIGILDKANMKNIICDTNIPSGSAAKVNITLNECDINIPDDKISPEYKTLFPAGGTGLDINYVIKGGSLNLSSQRWIIIQDKLDDCIYKAGSDGKYMTLSMSSCAVLSSAAYKLDGSSASSFELGATENNVSTYELSVSELSTRYGVIPAEYASVDDHPFVWFDESGTFKGSSTILYGSSSSTTVVGQAKTYLSDNKYDPATNSYGANPLGAYIVVRKDYTLTTSETNGNLAQIQGTLVIDLNDHTIYQNGKPLVDSTAKRWGNSGDQPIFPTEIKWAHGTISLKNSSIVNFTAWDSNGTGEVANKEFIHSFEGVTIQLAQGATATNLFTYTKNSSTPDAKSKATVNFTDCKFDLETVKPSSAITLFNASSENISAEFTVKGSEIYADSLEKVTLSNVASGSSVIAEENSEGELLKIYVSSANKGTVSGKTIGTTGGEAGFYEIEPEGYYSVFTIDKPTVPVLVGASVTKYNAEYVLETSDIFYVLTDGVNSSNSSNIDYKNSNKEKELGLDPVENKNQHWLLELDKEHTLGAINLSYSASHKWVELNVQVSSDNKTWTDLGTIRPEVAAANGGIVSIPLNSARGKYIKLKVVRRNATNVDNEATAWGPGMGAGCSLALYEIYSIDKASDVTVDNSIETPYGIIPEEYASIDSYPWVIFDENKNFLGATNILYGTNNENSIVGKAKAYLKGNVFDATNKTYGANEKKAYILLRKDYTLGSTERYGNMSQIQGTVTVDLGGFTLKTHSNWPLAYSQIKPWTGSGDASLFPTELAFINGTITLNSKGLGNYETWTSATDSNTNLTQKVFTHTYKNVTFNIPSGVNLSSLFTTTDKTHDAVGNINFTDCKFDFRQNVPTSNLTLFKANGKKIKLNYNIRGCEVHAPSMATIKLYDAETGSSVTAYKNSDGQYFKVFVSSENKLTFANSTMNTDSGETTFVEWTPAGSYSVFSLQEETATSDPLLTKYGTIPSEYKDIDLYPVVWFDEKGNFKGASNELFGVSSSTTSPVHLAKTYLKDNVYNPAAGNYGATEKKAYILLRKNYTMAANEAYGNLTQIQGTLTIDLNGNTIYQNTKPLVNSVSIRWSWSGDEAIFPTELIIENGEIVLKDNGLITFTAWDSNASGDIAGKVFTHTYNDVTIKLAENSTVSKLFNISKHANTPNAETKVRVNMNNCVFDFTNAPSTSLLMFDASGKYISSDYNIKGSEIYAETMENIKIASVADGSSVCAEKDIEGDYLRVHIKNENKDSFSKETILTDEGTGEFSMISSDDIYTEYMLTVNVEPSVNVINNVFASLDLFRTDNGVNYFGPVGVVFAEAPLTAGKYIRVECGIIFSSEELSREEFESASNTIRIKAKTVNNNGKYGIKLFGSGIKMRESYYVLPYAEYRDESGNIRTVYANQIITFSPDVK